MSRDESPRNLSVAAAKIICGWKRKVVQPQRQARSVECGGQSTEYFWRILVLLVRGHDAVAVAIDRGHDRICDIRPGRHRKIDRHAGITPIDSRRLQELVQTMRGDTDAGRDSDDDSQRRKQDSTCAQMPLHSRWWDRGRSCECDRRRAEVRI